MIFSLQYEAKSLLMEFPFKKIYYISTKNGYESSLFRLSLHKKLARMKHT